MQVKNPTAEMSEPTKSIFRTALRSDLKTTTELPRGSLHEGSGTKY